MPPASTPSSADTRPSKPSATSAVFKKLSEQRLAKRRTRELAQAMWFLVQAMKRIGLTDGDSMRPFVDPPAELPPAVAKNWTEKDSMLWVHGVRSHGDCTNVFACFINAAKVGVKCLSSCMYTIDKLRTSDTVKLFVVHSGTVTKFARECAAHVPTVETYNVAVTLVPLQRVKHTMQTLIQEQVM